MTTEARVIAKCGLDCTACPAYVATQNDDLEAKKKVAAEWGTAEYPLVAESVLCDGCGVGRRLMSFCTACTVMQCATARGLANCATCPDYGCEQLQKVWGGLGGGEAKQNLEAIRAGR